MSRTNHLGFLGMYERPQQRLIHGNHGQLTRITQVSFGREYVTVHINGLPISQEPLAYNAHIHVGEEKIRGTVAFDDQENVFWFAKSQREENG